MSSFKIYMRFKSVPLKHEKLGISISVKKYPANLQLLTAYHDVWLILHFSTNIKVFCHLLWSFKIIVIVYGNRNGHA